MTAGNDGGYASTALVLLVCILGSLAFLAFLKAGQHATCSYDSSRAYCEQAR